MRTPSIPAGRFLTLPVATSTTAASARSALATTALATLLAVALALLARPAAAQAAAGSTLYFPIVLAADAIAPTPLPTPTSTAEPASPLSVANVAVVSDPNDVRDLAVDSATGDVWAATYGGIVRWAAGGMTATVTTDVDGLWLAADDVAVGPNGDVWAVTDRGAARRRAAEGTWAAVQPPPLPTPADGGPGKPAVPRSVAVDGAGDVWIGIDDGVAKLSTAGRWSHVLGFEGATDRIVALSNGDLWFSTPFDHHTPLQLLRANGDRTAFETGRGGLRVKRPVDIAAAPGGAVWALDALGPPVVADAIDTAEGDSDWRPVPLGDLNARMAAVARPGPLRRVVFDAAGKPVIAAEGAVFLGAEEGAASRWTTLAVDEGPLAPLRELHALASLPNGDLWVGGTGGITVRAPSGDLTRRTAPGLAGNQILALALAPDGVWLGTRYGADRLAADGTLTHVDVVIARAGEPPLGPADERVNGIVAGRDGTVWFATPRGVMRRAPDGGMTTFGAAEGLVDPYTSALALGADGSLWCASGLAGQAADGRGKVGISRRLPDGAWLRYGFDDGLPALEPTVVLPRRDGSVWVGFDTRLAWRDQPFGARNMAFFRPEHPEEGWTRVAPPEPLIRDAVYALAETPDGALWVLGARGLSRLSADAQWTTYADQPAWRFGAAREAAALAATSDGTLWVGARSNPLRARRPDDTWGVVGDAPALGAVSAVAVGAEGRVWVGTAERGVRGFDPAP